MNNTKDLLIQTEKWLEKPIMTSIQDALSISDNLLLELQIEIQKQGSDKRELGSLIGKVKGKQRSIHAVELMDWVKVGDGELAIGHRPGSKLIIDLKLQNTTHILTLLSESEGASSISGLSGKSEIDWLWFPLESAKPPGEDRNEEVARLFREMKNILNDRGRIYIHCSAGIHRTGMITFGFLRFMGMEEDAAKQRLAELRVTSSEGVGAERLAWGNNVFKDSKEFRE